MTATIAVKIAAKSVTTVAKCGATGMSCAMIAATSAATAVTAASLMPPYRNWRYRPVTVGYRLQPAFYGSRYYISDYGRYNLRAPHRLERWIRYGDDLLLVNLRNGRVLRVIHYRYW